LGVIRVVTEIERGADQFRTENKIKKYVEKGTNSRNIFSRLQQKTIARAHSSSFFADFADFLLFSGVPPTWYPLYIWPSVCAVHL
jgi:hypothetical protein